MSVKHGLHGEITVPGDKSISHRAIMFGSLAKGNTEVTHFLQGADCLSTISCFQKLGVEIENMPDRIIIKGRGLHGLKMPDSVLDAGNSGTTTRLISGILAAQPFETVLTGDESIRRRPMGRIITPLSEMGANIISMEGNGCAPLKIGGASLKGINYQSKIASAQVKSAILLAGLYAEGETSVTEPVLSRNHSELMLKSFGADIISQNTTATIRPGNDLLSQFINVPGDISSAAYFVAAGLCVPNSEILIRNVGINPTRDGILKAALAMGGNITLLNENTDGEPTADLLVKSSSLHGITIEGDIIPTLIDEIPIICVMASYAQGTTVIKDAAELKVKESDRISVMTENLSAMGAHITDTEDGMIIEGGYPLHGAMLDAHLDHRIAMSFAIADLLVDGETIIKGRELANISYPSFYDDLYSLLT